MDTALFACSRTCLESETFFNKFFCSGIGVGNVRGLKEFLKERSNVAEITWLLFELTPLSVDIRNRSETLAYFAITK